jgi:LysM repeat protein
MIPVSTRLLQPTPTIFTYTVVAGDTLSSVARRTGVSLEALLAANPGISATALPVGTKLVIPAGEQAPGEATPTAVPLPLRQAYCWPETSGGLWCFALVQNEDAVSLENLSAQFALLDSDGQGLADQVAYGLLDILAPGASMPLAAHFPPPVQAGASAAVQILTANRILPGEARYLPVSLDNTLVSVEASGRSARVSGRVLLAGTGTANTVWVLATAFDAAGNVVGLRRWESGTVLSAAAPVPFDFQVSSLGPAISRVEFLAEARP